MESYLLKTILCSALFIVFYYLFLEKEKSLKFNRFYLLGSIILSLIIPLMHFTVAVLPKTSGLEFGDALSTVQNSKSVSILFTLNNILLAISSLISIFLFLRFIKGLLLIRSEIRHNKKIEKDGIFIVLKKLKTAPHSFWNHIFLNKEDYVNGKIDEKIILHEQTHIRQKHSLDLIFIEILLVLFYFNPAFYLFKKAILNNHEYLADEKVLKTEPRIKEYQHLLLQELISEKILFTNKFNLFNTKKRIIMMTKTLTPTARLKTWLALPLSIGLFFLFAEKVTATDIEEPINNSSTNPMIKSSVPEIVPVKVASFIVANDTIPKTSKKADKKVKGTTPLVTPPPPPPREVIQTPAEYPGGVNELRKSVSGLFNGSVFKGDEGLMKTTIYFKIDETGKVSDVTAVGESAIFNNEAVRSVVDATKSTLWKPATEEGKIVRSVFKIPLTMKFEY